MSDTPESVRAFITSMYSGDKSSMEVREAAEEVLTRYADHLERTCEWLHDDLHGDYYSTQCGNAYTFIDGGPKDNKQLWCGYCGARIVEVRG